MECSLHYDFKYMHMPFLITNTHNCIISFISSSLIFLSCSSSKSQEIKQGIIQQKTQFYNTNGEVTFTHYIKLFFKDSVSVQEIRGVTTITDTANKKTVTYPLLFCRYIDLRSKALYDYETFSDTASIIHKAILPDSLMLDGGWSFYSEKAPIIQGTPETIPDTVINNINYKRAKFIFSWTDPKKTYLIGHFICDGRGDMFSLEKAYSRRQNCILVSFFDYKVNSVKPFASVELSFLSSILSKEELKILDTWERNAKNNPIPAK